MKQEMSGLQVKCKIGSVHYLPEIEEMTIDCHLGSLIIKKEELLNYLETRKAPDTIEGNGSGGLVEAAEKLRDCLVEYDYVGDDGLGDIPDEIWLPFCNAIESVKALPIEETKADTPQLKEAIISFKQAKEDWEKNTNSFPDGKFVKMMHTADVVISKLESLR